MASKLEGAVKDDFGKMVRSDYPRAHYFIIPASKFALLPYDAGIVYQGIYRAIEFKIDHHPVEPHQYHAMYECIKAGGYAFVVRWLNEGEYFIVDNLYQATSEKFKAEPSLRQLNGESHLDRDAKPAHGFKNGCMKAIAYVMQWTMPPIEEQIQKVLREEYMKDVDDAVMRKTGKIK